MKLWKKVFIFLSLSYVAIHGSQSTNFYNYLATLKDDTILGLKGTAKAYLSIESRYNEAMKNKESELTPEAQDYAVQVETQLMRAKRRAEQRLKYSSKAITEFNSQLNLIKNKIKQTSKLISILEGKNMSTMSSTEAKSLDEQTYNLEHEKERYEEEELWLTDALQDLNESYTTLQKTITLRVAHE